MNPPHDFRECLARSHAAADLPIWEQMYRQAFGDFQARHDHRQDGPHQREGIDVSVILHGGRQLWVDEKIRGRGKNGKIYDDVALEYVSNDRTNAPGWVEKKHMLTDYIAYAIAPRGVGYLLPLVQLQQAWAANKAGWLRKFREPVHNAPNNGYRTLFCPVPVAELFKAIGSQLRLTFTPFEFTEGVPVQAPAIPNPVVPSPALLEPDTCPGCHGPLDNKGRCWRCCYRRCERCGKSTGSAFLALCLTCDLGRDSLALPEDQPRADP
jgi:hypothetical protein